MPAVIIPERAVNEIKRIVESHEGAIKISVSPNKFKVETSDTVFVTKVIDGQYPDYQRVIPFSNPHRATLNAKELGDAISRVSTLCDERTQSVAFKFDQNTLEIDTNNSELGSANESLEIENSYSNKVNIGLNARYIDQICKQIKNGDFNFIYDGPNSPILVQQEQNKHKLFVVMPMRI